MNTSECVQPHHLARKAVIYIRQSTAHQVLSNLESQHMQRAMRERALQLGWAEERIETVEVDTGTSAQSTVGREGYKNLVAEITLGQVGMVLSYESARLSRNCTDWYPLLDACAHKHCLIADREGVHDPGRSNDRLLLGMKGMLSEFELHTLRGRLVAGALNKARRGELAINLPAGLVRLEDGRVVKDPNLQVQESIGLVFRTFGELKSASHVARRLRRSGIQLPRRHHNVEIVWREPTAGRVLSILTNPAFTGAFVYGRVHNTKELERDGFHVRRHRQGLGENTVVVKDHHPAYVTWETFEEIQGILKDNRAEYQKRLSRGIPRGGEALLQGIAYCGECGHKLEVQYKRRPRYRCDEVHRTLGEKLPSFLAAPIDRAVSQAFFEALSPAEFNAYERALETRRQSDREIEAAQERELQRLRYEADLARRQYDRVDPDNRLVASELERRWEVALRALQGAEQDFERRREERQRAIEARIPKELRTALESLGRSMPQLWESGSVGLAHRKALLRCLVDKVVLKREAPGDRIHVRIVWKGGADTDLDVAVDVGSYRSITRFEQMRERVLDLEASGKSDEEIATILTAEGHHSAKGTRVLPSTVRIIRVRAGRRHRYQTSRDKRITGYLTVPQIAKTLGVTNDWIYHRIKSGAITATLDAATRLYLFPDRAETIEKIKKLRTTSTGSVTNGGGYQHE
jgi:DNA invertase Pin-like site-specific DNA recombinase